MAKQAPRFFIVALPDKEAADWKHGVVAKFREQYAQGFLAKEGIKYPDRFTGKPMEVLAQINEWLNANAKALVGGTAVPASAPRKSRRRTPGINAQHVYDALAKTGPKATTKDVIRRLQANLPGHIVESNLEKLQHEGMAFSYGPSGELAIFQTHSYGPKGASGSPMPFWATREQVITRGLAAEADLPPVTANWTKPASKRPMPSERDVTQPPVMAPALRIDSPNALTLLAGIEGPIWLKSQEADRSSMNDPTGFYANLVAYQILRDMGERAAGLTVADVVPSAGLLIGMQGRAYALLPDGQIALDGQTATGPVIAHASRFMRVV